MGKIPDAIVQASDHTAHLVLLALCRESTYVAEKAEHVLNKIAARDKSAVERKAGDEVPLVCWNCDVFYFEEENHDRACQFHDGELEETEESFPDTDPWMIEGMDEDELREAFPFEYWWTCCGKQGCEDKSLGPRVALREGCVIRRHMTEEEAGKGSISSSSSSSSSSNSKRPATTEIYDGSVKRLAVAAPTAASVLPPSGIKVTPVPVPVLPPAYGSRVTPIPPPVLPPTAAGIPVQPTVITLSDEEDEGGGDNEDDDEDDEDDDEEDEDGFEEK